MYQIEKQASGLGILFVQILSTKSFPSDGGIRHSRKGPRWGFLCPPLFTGVTLKNCFPSKEKNTLQCIRKYTEGDHEACCHVSAGPFIYFMNNILRLVRSQASFSFFLIQEARENQLTYFTGCIFQFKHQRGRKVSSQSLIVPSSSAYLFLII